MQRQQETKVPQHMVASIHFNRNILEAILRSNGMYYYFVKHIQEHTPNLKTLPINMAFHAYVESFQTHDWVLMLGPWGETKQGHSYWACIHDEFLERVNRSNITQDKPPFNSIW